MSHPSVRGEIAAQRAKREVLIELQAFPGGDARAVAANVDGLGHLEVAAIGKVQANKHPLGDAFFGALTGEVVEHSNRQKFRILQECRAGRTNAGNVIGM